jgi:hypothetical protein
VIWPNVYFGKVEKLDLPDPLPDLEDDPDDEELTETPEDVIKILGFDPLEMDEEDEEEEETEKGGPGSGNFGHRGRPGSAGGSSAGGAGNRLASPRLEQYARQGQSAIREWQKKEGNTGSGREAAVVYRRDGTSGRYVGGDNYVNVPKESLKNAVYVCHNHPSTASFSADDVVLMAKNKINRMDVVCRDGVRFVLERTKNTTPNFKVTERDLIGQAQIGRLWVATEAVLRPPFKARYQQGEDAKKLWREHTHEVMNRMAKFYGLNYKMVPASAKAEGEEPDEDEFIVIPDGEGDRLDDSSIANPPYADEEETEKHYGPGPHRSGTPQSVHGGVGHGDVNKPAAFEKPGLASTLLSRLIAEEGFSYQPVKGQSPTTGYMVSRYKRRELVLGADKVTPKDIESYSRKNQDLLSRPDHYFGAWIDNKKVYLDVSVNVPTREQALKLARQHKQEGIWDVKEFKTIYTSEATGA